MAFPVLFPNLGKASFKQQLMKKVKLHEYALHLIKYHDNRFGQHPRFCYFILNIMMQHQIQSTTSIFIKKNMNDNLPTIIQDLQQRLKDVPDNKIVDHLMHFGSTIQGTKPFWNLRRVELSDMIIQIGCPTLFFTLSAANTKWPNLHNIMPTSTPTNPQLIVKWRIQNIIQNPHLVAMYMHCRFTSFFEEVLEKLLDAQDYWYRYTIYDIFNFLLHSFILLANY